MDLVINYFRSIIIFLIFINFITILMPNKKYNNYMDFVLGLILISIIISPILNILNFNNSEIEPQILTKNYTQNVYTSDVNNTTELYQQQLSTQIKNTLEKSFDITVTNLNVKISDDDYSKIEQIYMQFQNNDVYIEPINISNTNSDDVETKNIKTIKNYLSSEYNLSLDNIYMSIE